MILKSKKAPGDDKLSNRLKELLDKYLKYLTNLTNGKSLLQIFPDTWKNLIVLNLNKNHRLISVLSYVSKGSLASYSGQYRGGERIQTPHPRYSVRFKGGTLLRAISPESN